MLRTNCWSGPTGNRAVQHIKQRGNGQKPTAASNVPGSKERACNHCAQRANRRDRVGTHFVPHQKIGDGFYDLEIPFLYRAPESMHVVARAKGQ